MKLKINLGEELKYAKFTHPDVVPLLSEFRHDKVIGECRILSLEEAEVKVTNQDFIEELNKIFQLGVAGRVTEREGNQISGFHLMSCSIEFKDVL